MAYGRSRNIKGITIEIGANVTPLLDALKNVDRELGRSQANLRDINKLLKTNAGNATLLAQKQREMQTSITVTKNRLTELKKVERSSVNPEQWDAIQREIIDTEQKLKRLQREYADFGSVTAQRFQAAGEAIKSAGKKISDVGMGLTKSITAPLLAVGAAANSAFNAVDEGVDSIIKATGATGPALEGLEDNLKNIATRIPTDFKTAGDAIGAVNTRFGLAGEELENLSETFIKFAQINDTDVVSSVNSVQKAMAAWNMDSSEAGDYLNRLTSVAQRTGASVDTLLQGVQSNSVAFQQMGMSIDSATEFMGQLELSGADSSTVMSGLNKALKNAAESGRPLDRALADLQRQLERGRGGMSGLQIAYDMFGKSGAQVYQLVKDGVLDFRDLNNAAELTGDTVSDTFQATLDPADEFKTTLNNLKIAGSELAEAVMPKLSEILSKVSGVIQSARDKWNSLSDSQKNSILKFAGIAAAAGPVITTVGKLVSGVGGLITTAGKLGGALAGFMPPAGAIIAGVLAAGTLIIANWDKIVALWDTYLKPAIDAIGEALQGLWKDHLEPVATWIGTTFAAAWSGVESVFNGVIDFVSNVFTGNWDAAWQTIVENFGGIFAKIADLVKSPINAVIDAINWLIEKVEGGINTIINGINNNLRISIPSFSIGWPINKTFGGWSWGASLTPVQWGRLDHLANGGVLREGMAAMVGEYAPEILRVVNGQAVVTPIENGGRDKWRLGGQGTVNNNITINQLPGESSEALAQRVQTVLTRWENQRRAVYGR